MHGLPCSHFVWRGTASVPVCVRERENTSELIGTPKRGKERKEQLKEERRELTRNITRLTIITIIITRIA